MERSKFSEQQEAPMSMGCQARVVTARRIGAFGASTLW